VTESTKTILRQSSYSLKITVVKNYNNTADRQHQWTHSRIVLMTSFVRFL